MPSKKIEATIDGFPRGIGAPATRALNHAGFTTLRQLTRVNEAELMALHGFGPKALRILKATLKARGLALSQPDGARKSKKTLK